MLRHTERHKRERMGWLRAAVMGANDGLVSTSSLVLGSPSAQAGGARVLKAAARVTFWGALAMALTALVGSLFGVAA